MKKQTAIRLANEPENPEFHRHPNERNMQIHDLKRQTALRLAKEQGQSRATGEGGMQILPPEQMQYQPVYLPPPPAFTPVDPNRVAHDSRIFDGPVPMENRSFSRYEGQCMVDPNLSNQIQYPQSRNNVTSMPNVSHLVVYARVEFDEILFCILLNRYYSYYLCSSNLELAVEVRRESLDQIDRDRRCRLKVQTHLVREARERGAAKRCRSYRTVLRSRS